MVVIAIIGLLASIILVSLGRARAKAKDARLLLDLRQIRSIASLIESTYNSYTNLCDPITSTLNQNDPLYGSQIKVIEDDILEQVGGSPFSFLLCYDYKVLCINNFK